MDCNHQDSFFHPKRVPIHLTGHLKEPIDVETGKALERILKNSLPQLVEVTWNATNKEHYMALGYPFSKCGKTVLVSPFHLSPQTHLDVWVTCEICRIVKPLGFGNLLKNLRGIVKIFACKACKSAKIKQSNLIVYGVENTGQLPEVQEKARLTVRENHGVTNVMHNSGIKKKLKATNMNRHGVSWYTASSEFQRNREKNMMNKHGVTSPLQKPEFLEKAKQTCLDRYGVENAFQNKSVRLKALATLKANHGVSHPFQIPGVSEKAAIKRAETLEKNGNGVKTSIAQLYIYQLMGGLLEPELNRRVGSYFLDIAFSVCHVHIDTEYNGFGHYYRPRFGHLTWEEFKKKENKRYYALKQKKWMLIRIVNKEDDKLPKDSVLLSLLKRAISHLINGHSWFEINLTTSCVSYRDNGNLVNEPVRLGRKRKISPKDIKNIGNLTGGKDGGENDELLGTVFFRAGEV